MKKQKAKVDIDKLNASKLIKEKQINNGETVKK